MATWGKRRIKIDGGDWLDTIYYSYNTTCDQYHFVTHWTDEYTHERRVTEDHIGKEQGRAMMEAFIAHTLSYDCGSVEGFVERYITNNRFLTEGEEVDDPMADVVNDKAKGVSVGTQIK